MSGRFARNTHRSASGQVYTQNECLSHPVIRTALDKDRPENVIMLTEKSVWVIEAKRSHKQLAVAVSEAEDYARRITDTGKLTSKFISGVAGNSLDGFLVSTRMLVGNRYLPIKINDVEITALLSESECRKLLDTGVPSLDNPPIDVRFFLSRADHINEVLYLGAVNPHQRASVMSALLLSMVGETMPNIEEKEASVLIGDINARVKAVLKAQGKEGFYDHIRIALPSTPDNHIKFRKAVVETIQELNNLNIRSAMNSGADWLGAFYEVFLKYASWAQDLGIVLTPRHITTFIADVMDIRPNDIIFDPTCGTGGFLVAAFDSVKKKSTPAQLKNFKQYAVFGIEQDAGVAALAVVNMIFRGDGKNNIIEGNCFSKNLSPDNPNTAKYTVDESTNPPITKVMMNPPFSLKGVEEKEYQFIDHALKQVEHNGILFSVLPYAAMVKPGGYKTWRRNIMLAGHTLLSVVTFPSDLFYPVGVHSVGIFLRKGVPHPRGQKVLWIRALNDGLLKSKGKRLPSGKASNDLEIIKDTLRSFLQNPEIKVQSKQQFIKASPLDMTDSLVELVPEAYLDQAKPNEAIVIEELEQSMRNLLAFLIKINRFSFTSGFSSVAPRKDNSVKQWKAFKVTDLFNIGRGNFHSITALDPGTFPTISRTETDNGLVGFFDRPEGAEIYRPGTITISTVTGDAFIQPVPFIATDNVLLCIPNEQFRNLSLESLFFISVMLNEVKWRYGYGRQPYLTKFSVTEIMLPADESGNLDEQYMTLVVQGSSHWQLIKQTIESQEMPIEAN
jgi:type I restriction-modification system DNA methylase subunit